VGHRQLLPVVRRLVFWPLLTLLSVVAGVPVGIGQLFWARASASPKTLLSDGPSTTSSDGGVLLAEDTTCPSMVGRYPSDSRTPLYTLGTPSIVPYPARRTSRAVPCRTPSGQPSENSVQRQSVLANQRRGVPPYVIGPLVNPYVTAPYTKRNTIGTDRCSPAVHLLYVVVRRS